MDGISGAASLIAIVTMALQSTKIIFETVTGIHNGPPLLQQLASELQNLQDILQRVIELSKDPAQNNFTDFKGLENLSRRCDLEKMEGKLESLCGGRKIEKAWNKLKTYLHIKYLEEIRTRIRHHVQALIAEFGVAAISSGLDSVQRSKQALPFELIIAQIFELHSFVNTDDISRMNTTMQKYFVSSASRANLLSEEIKATYGQCASSVKNLSHQNSTNHLAAMEFMRNHREELSRVHHSVEALQQISVSSNARSEEAASSSQSEALQTSQAIASISARLDGLSSISQDQYATLQRILEQILNNQKAPVPSDQPCNMTAHLSTAGTANCPEEITEDKDNGTDGPQSPSAQLVESIHRLWSLASTTDTTYFSEGAQSIIDDLEKLLSAASESGVKGKARASRKRQVEELCDHDDANELQGGRDLKRVRGLLTASQLVQVAKKGLPQVANSLRPLAKIQNRCETIQFQAGTVTILSRSQDFRHSQKRPKNLSQPAADAHDRDLLEVFTSTITFIPTNHVVRAKLRAAFCQDITTKGFSSIHPTLSFCSMMSADSIIFKIIEEGDMEELVSMFEKNLAAVTDCDPDGRSLLGYAFYNYSVDICKFLLQHGADPNSVERGRDIYDRNLRERGRQRYEDNLQCRKLLLNAGSDPSIEIVYGEDGKTYSESYLKDLFNRSGTPVELKRFVIDCDEFWFDIEHDFGDGQTPLLLAASGFGGDICPETVRLLIQRGANVATRDRYGKTCLHMTLSENRFFNERVQRSLTLLVDAGADVHAVDNDGTSVSEVAIWHRNWNLWQKVLQNCGKDLDQFYVVLRQKGWLFPGDPDYDYKRYDGEPSYSYRDNNDSQTGSDSDGDDSEGGVGLYSHT